MNIRKATIEDLEEILDIYEEARAFMVQTGNPTQWAAKNWPPEWLIRQDIAEGKSYVCQDSDDLAAVFFYDYGADIDPCYRRIEDGAWKDDSAYGVVHRIAARKGRGAGKLCIRWAYEQCGHLRIDTHKNNKVMQNVLQQMDFAYCGVIYVSEDADGLRIAYEKI